MTRFSGRRKIAVLFLGLFLAAPWASALEPQGRPEPRTERFTIEPVHGLLAGLWEFLSSIWVKAGCSADPNGGCASQPVGGGSSTTSDAGGSLDPDG
jgi:hypothetical protein